MTFRSPDQSVQCIPHSLSYLSLSSLARHGEDITQSNLNNMFNAPRRGAGLSGSAFLQSTSETPSTTIDPLASSMPTSTSYGEVDPWSSAPTPTQGTPQRPGRESDEPDAEASGLMAKVEGVSAREGLSAFLRECLGDPSMLEHD